MKKCLAFSLDIKGKKMVKQENTFFSKAYQELTNTKIPSTITDILSVMIIPFNWSFSKIQVKCYYFQKPSLQFLPTSSDY